MTTTISISHRIDRPSGDLRTYQIGFGRDPGSRLAPLSSMNGPVYDNVARSIGAYPTRAEAIRAALDYIGCCTIVRHVDQLDGSVSYSVRAAHHRPKDGEVVGRRTERGTWIEAEG